MTIGSASSFVNRSAAVVFDASNKINTKRLVLSFGGYNHFIFILIIQGAALVQIILVFTSIT